MKTVNNTSLYLAQSCQDAWNDHIRSLNTPSFPTWDYVILTASVIQQAVGFQKQLAGRKGFLPEHTIRSCTGVSMMETVFPGLSCRAQNLWPRGFGMPIPKRFLHGTGGWRSL